MDVISWFVQGANINPEPTWTKFSDVLRDNGSTCNTENSVKSVFLKCPFLRLISDSCGIQNATGGASTIFQNEKNVKDVRGIRWGMRLVQSVRYGSGGKSALNENGRTMTNNVKATNKTATFTWPECASPPGYSKPFSLRTDASEIGSCSNRTVEKLSEPRWIDETLVYSDSDKPTSE